MSHYAINPQTAYNFVSAAVLICTGLLIALPPPGTCEECIPGKFYAVVYGIIHRVGTFRGRAERKDAPLNESGKST